MGNKEFVKENLSDKKNNTENMGQYITYMYDLTDEQKELINKIFQKWSNTDDRNSK